jgi:hypothetical protein
VIDGEIILLLDHEEQWEKTASNRTDCGSTNEFMAAQWKIKERMESTIYTTAQNNDGVWISRLTRLHGGIVTLPALTAQNNDGVWISRSMWLHGGIVLPALHVTIIL